MSNSPRLMLTINSRMLACAMFCHSSCTCALLREAQQQIRVKDSYQLCFWTWSIISSQWYEYLDSWLLGFWQQEIGRTGKNVQIYPCCMSFAPPQIKALLSANTWLSTCGLTWGLTISSIYFCAVRPPWMSRPACNFCWHIPTYRLIYLQKHCLEQCTHRKGAHDDKWSTFFADFTPSLEHVHHHSIFEWISRVIIIIVWNLNCYWCILTMNWTMLKPHTEMLF